MIYKHQKQTVFLFGGVLFLIALDQLTKMWARESLDATLCNAGIALSMPLPLLLTIVTSLGIICLLVVWFVRHSEHSFVERTGLALLIAGGIGNVIDRLLFGCVTDFVAFFDLWHFNVADTAIAAGVAAIMWHMIVIVPTQGRDCDVE